MTNIRTSGANLDHYQIIRRMGAKLTAPAAGAPTLRSGPSALAQPARAPLRAILAPRAMVQALAGLLAFRCCSAPPGSTQEPPRRSGGSGLAMRGVEGGAA
ncbi:hypothetical protein [Variovorax sp. OK605]|jgi:hypothetical protein|uniref:hypothetical protein n=1 Tax=Variovorax sp. OK605 TaxID=1855317 RepID=UPI00116097CC|nr:hypothetical protein [Variovorax sp. OK605]